METPMTTPPTSMLTRTRMASLHRMREPRASTALVVLPLIEVGLPVGVYPQPKVVEDMCPHMSPLTQEPHLLWPTAATSDKPSGHVLRYMPARLYVPRPLAEPLALATIFVIKKRLLRHFPTYLLQQNTFMLRMQMVKRPTSMPIFSPSMPATLLRSRILSGTWTNGTCLIPLSSPSSSITMRLQ